MLFHRDEVKQLFNCLKGLYCLIYACVFLMNKMSYELVIKCHSAYVCIDLWGKGKVRKGAHAV